jgi:hypothetical protein
MSPYKAAAARPSHRHAAAGVGSNQLHLKRPALRIIARVGPEGARSHDAELNGKQCRATTTSYYLLDFHSQTAYCKTNSNLNPSCQEHQLPIDGSLVGFEVQGKKT